MAGNKEEETGRAEGCSWAQTPEQTLFERRTPGRRLGSQQGGAGSLRSPTTAMWTPHTEEGGEARNTVVSTVSCLLQGPACPAVGPLLVLTMLSWWPWMVSK